mmetsp:Transcript_521/g.1069  ORF Transcript_521/g.1069 Transcript_521/m.1069 type:complete len:228 (+) Transcript_521:1305-1988(+)
METEHLGPSPHDARVSAIQRKCHPQTIRLRVHGEHGRAPRPRRRRRHHPAQTDRPALQRLRNARQVRPKTPKGREENRRNQRPDRQIQPRQSRLRRLQLQLQGRALPLPRHVPLLQPRNRRDPHLLHRAARPSPLHNSRHARRGLAPARRGRRRPLPRRPSVPKRSRRTGAVHPLQGHTNPRGVGRVRPAGRTGRGADGIASGSRADLAPGVFDDERRPVFRLHRDR